MVFGNQDIFADAMEDCFSQAGKTGRRTDRLGRFINTEI